MVWMEKNERLIVLPRWVKALHISTGIRCDITS